MVPPKSGLPPRPPPPPSFEARLRWLRSSIVSQDTDVPVKGAATSLARLEGQLPTCRGRVGKVWMCHDLHGVT